MKILMATMGLDIGGAETHIVELIRELRRQGHDIAVASNGGAYVPEIVAAGVRHYSVPMHKRDVGMMLRSYRLLRDIIRRERPDVVHAHARIPGFLCGLLKKTMGFPFVTTAHWVFDTSGALRFLTNWGDRTIAVSEDIKRYLMESYGTKEENISVTINGIDTDKFSPEISGAAVRKEFGIGPDVPVVVHVSRLDESRALAARHLILAASAIAEAVPDVTLLIAGGGDTYGELCRLAEEANGKIGRRCVVMAGPRTDINQIVAAGDVFVGVSRAALEAMSAGKPTVVAGNEGTLGLFTEEKLAVGIEGNFCCRGCGAIEAETFTRDVIGCLTLPEGERKRLSDYGRQVVCEHYSVARMAQDALDAYRAAMGPRKILLSGYYGFDNAGDEAILESVVAGIRATVENTEITILSRTPRVTAERYGCRAVQRFNPFALYRAVGRCGVLVSGGGSLLQDATSSRSLWYYLFILRIAERKRKRVILLANGIGPVLRERNRKRVRRAVEEADLVTLRDGDSLQFLREIGVTREDIQVIADPVFLLPQPEKAVTKALLERAGVQGDFIAVSVRPVEGGGFADELARVCDELNRRFDVTTVFLPFQPERDVPVSREIAARMETPSVVLTECHSVMELMGVVQSCRLILSMRLHALIFAAHVATPAVGFSYDPKVEAYLRLLDQPSAGNGASVDVESAVRAASAILEDREQAVAKLLEKRDRMTALAEGNLAVFRKLN